MTQEDMKFQEMLTLLSITADREWTISPLGCIRTRGGECPICAMVNEILGTDYTQIAWGALQDLSNGEWEEVYFKYSNSVRRVIKATDNRTDAEDDRAALMGVLGLTGG